MKFLYLAGLLSLGAMALVGCRTTKVGQDQNAPPRYAESVQVITYDSTPRPFNPSITVFYNFAGLENRPRHPIAELDKVAFPNDQALVRNALIWRAKSLGADGILMLPPSTGAISFAITNTVVSNNANGGIFYFQQSGSATANGIIDHVIATNNLYGIAINTGNGSTTAAISNSVAGNNTNDGINIANGSAPLTVSIDNTGLSGNGAGIVADGTPKVLLGRSAITGNGEGVITSDAGFFFTYKDNRINGNGADVSGPTPTTDGLQ